MGSAFAVPCIENKNDVTIVGTHLENELIDNLNSNNKIHPTLKTQLATEIKFEKFEKLQTILKQNLDIIVCGVSSAGIEWFVNQISKNYKNTTSIVLLTKGLIHEEESRLGYWEESYENGQIKSKGNYIDG